LSTHLEGQRDLEALLSRSLAQQVNQDLVVTPEALHGTTQKGGVFLGIKRGGRNNGRMTLRLCGRRQAHVGHGRLHNAERLVRILTHASSLSSNSGDSRGCSSNSDGSRGCCSWDLLGGRRSILLRRQLLLLLLLWRRQLLVLLLLRRRDLLLRRQGLLRRRLLVLLLLRWGLLLLLLLLVLLLRRRGLLLLVLLRRRGLLRRRLLVLLLLVLLLRRRLVACRLLVRWLPWGWLLVCWLRLVVRGFAGRGHVLRLRLVAGLCVTLRGLRVSSRGGLSVAGLCVTLRGLRVSSRGGLSVAGLRGTCSRPTPSSIETAATVNQVAAPSDARGR